MTGVQTCALPILYNHDAAGTIKGTAAGEGAGQDDVKTMDLRLSHANPQITEIYNEFLEAPLSHLAHELCHTTYEDRSGSLTPSSGRYCGTYPALQISHLLFRPLRTDG